MHSTTTPTQSRSESTADRLDSHDRFDATSAQLRSLLTMLSGEGFAAFKNLSGDNQQNLIWLASDLAEEIACVGKLVAGARA
jgi:hypothetical protein